MTSRRPREKTIRGVHPNAGIEAAYRARLERLVNEMAKSIEYWVPAAYRANLPELALDAAIDAQVEIEVREQISSAGKTEWVAYIDGDPLRTASGKPRKFKSRASALRNAKIELGQYVPTEDIQGAVNELAERWQAKFDAMAPELANYFSTQVAQRTDAALRTALKNGGISVEFQMTPAMRNIVQATTEANVGLIRSIPQQYLTNVQGAVMRSIQSGRDLGPLVEYLEKEHGVTRRRAAFIALDQNNKATSAMTRARQDEIGIVKARWRHSGGGKHPRPKHVAANGTEYDVKVGLPIGDKGQNVFPGEEPNCRCISISIIPTGLR